MDEAKAIREGVGLIDASAFAKHRVYGTGSVAFLDWFTCNKLPKVGRINLTYALIPAGTTRTEYTIVRDTHYEFYLVSSGAWAEYDAGYLRKAAEDWTVQTGGESGWVGVAPPRRDAELPVGPVDGGG